MSLSVINLVLLLLVLAGAIGLWVYMDYRGWLALGRGGIPHNFRGWLIMTRLRLRKANAITTATYEAQAGQPGNLALLANLPRRNGPRPRINPWPIPHRMADQFVGTQMRRRLDALFAEVVAANPELVDFKLSFFETHNPAITLCDHGSGHPHAKLSRGEVAHIHPGDGSMHMVFSPADAKTVIETGWGERHSMAGVLPELPDTYIFIYPPRDEFELMVVKDLLLASIDHMSQNQRRAVSNFSDQAGA